MGHADLPGHQLHSGFGRDLYPPEKDGLQRGRAPVFLCHLKAACRCGHSQHPAAKLYLGGQYHHSGRYQRLWPGCHCGLFRLGKAEQSGDHLFHDPWQRCVQLHLAEYRCRKDRPCAKGLSRRCGHCVADLHSAGGAVFLPGRSFDPILYERTHAGSHAHRHSVFAHSFALLFCDLRQAGGRRHSEGQPENELVYDRYLL